MVLCRHDAPAGNAPHQTRHENGHCDLKPLQSQRERFGENLALLAIGGVLYSVGALVYASKWPDLLKDVVGFHGIWHVFVLGGVYTQYRFNEQFVLTSV
jgi:predicted membrane channel-forming protein YqfA (hemolysin III family)